MIARDNMLLKKLRSIYNKQCVFVQYVCAFVVKSSGCSP